MDVHVIATGSKGNAYILKDGDRSILIDPGINIKEIRKKTPVNLATLDLCLISHEHNDHIKAIKDIVKIGVKCAASKGTHKYIPGLNGNRVIMEKKKEYHQAGWKVLPFDTEHDAEEPMGFLIQSQSGKKILYATDTYYLKYKFTGVTHFIIECNYYEQFLQENNSIPDRLKERIRLSHFELDNVKEFFKHQDLSKTEKIYLIHLSEENADPQFFKEEIERITEIPVYFS